MPSLLERLGVELPVVQAGMGGGLSRHELAAAVSEVGGLGTIAVNGAGAIRRELAAARALTGRPLAVKVLLPFARRDWFAAAGEADVVVTFVEAGGHVRGTTPALRLLQEARRSLPECPVLMAGGIATHHDVRAALEAGALAALAGTRFLLSEESRAHPDYKQRLLDADRTLLTELFGAGWPAPHRVIPNAATERWLRRDFRGPRFNRLVNRLLAPGTRYLPAALQARIVSSQRPASRLLSPAGPTDDGPATLVDAGALYAGETVTRIGEIRPAADLVRELAA